MINAITSSPEIFDPFVIAFIGGVACTILGIIAGYIQGHDAARLESNKFWTMQKKIKAKNVLARHEKKMKECERGLETRRRREGVIVNGTECER